MPNHKPPFILNDKRPSLVTAISESAGCLSVFRYTSGERLMHHNQQAYYPVIRGSSQIWGSTPFIAFMLDMIRQTIFDRGDKTTQETTRETTQEKLEQERTLFVAKDPNPSSEPLDNAGPLDATKPNHPQQAYIAVGATMDKEHQ